MYAFASAQKQKEKPSGLIHLLQPSCMLTLTWRPRNTGKWWP